MTSLFTVVLMAVLSSVTALALWHCLVAINHMTPRTHHGIRMAHVFKALGLFMLLLAVVDYVFGQPLTWPWLLLSGVTLQTGGSAALHVVTRRLCHCPECPIRSTSTLCEVKNEKTAAAAQSGKT